LTQTTIVLANSP